MPFAPSIRKAGMPAWLNKFGRVIIAAWRETGALAGWPAAARCDVPFADADVARLHGMNALRSAAAPVASVDADTWDRMLMPAYLASLVKGTGICGQQQLYAWLRGGQDDAGRAALALRIEQWEAAGSLQAAQLADVCLPLRTMQTEVTGLLFDDEPPAPPRWVGKCWLLMAGLLVSLALVALSPLAWLAVLSILVQMMVVQLRYMGAAEQGARLLDSVQLLLRGCSLAATSPHPALGEFAPLATHAGRLNRALSPSPVRQLSGVAVYLDWFLQSNIEHHFKSMGRIASNRDFLRQCFQLCARLEADLALVRHRAQVPTCGAQRGLGIGLADAVHPLLAAPSPLSVELQERGVFVSGQNGIGKSTLLRTVGLNLLAARAFGFCYAASAVVPMLPVVASMQNEDNLQGGASLYVAELQRARALLELARAGAQCVFII